MSGEDESVVMDHDEFIGDTDDEELTDDDGEGEQQEESEEESGAEEDGDDQESDGDEDGSDDGEDEDDSSQEPEAKGRDKALIKLQQRQTTLEKQLNERFDGIGEQLEKLSKLADAIDKRGGEPTKRQEQQVENVKDKLGKLLDGDPDDFIDKGTLKEILGQIGDKQSDPVDIQSEVKKLLEAEKKAEADRQKAVQDFLRKEAEDFDDMYPEIAGKYPDISKQASDEVSKRYGKLDPEDYERRYNMLFAKMSAEASQKALAKEQPSKARPAGKKPPKSAKGASTKTAGATAKTGGGSKVVYFDNDMDKAIHDLSDDD